MSADIGAHTELSYMSKFNDLIILTLTSTLVSWLICRQLKRISPLPLLLSISFGLSAVYFRDYSKYDVLDRMMYHTIVIQSTLLFFLYALVPLLVTKNIKSWVECVFGVICLADSATVIGQWWQGYPMFDRGGIFNNASMNGCIIGILYPFLIPASRFLKTKLKYLLFVIPIAAVLLTGSSGPLITLGVVFLFFLIRTFWINPYMLGLILVLMLGAFISLRWSLPSQHTFLGDNGRVELWNQAINWWSESPGNLYIGSGNGATGMLLPYLQFTKNPQTMGFFIYLHNDWLQSFMELGLLGIIGIFWIAYDCMCEAFKKPVYGASFFAFAVTAFFNWPVHSAMSAFAGMFVVVSLLRGHEKNRREP